MNTSSVRVVAIAGTEECLKRKISFRSDFLLTYEKVSILKLTGQPEHGKGVLVRKQQDMQNLTPTSGESSSPNMIARSLTKISPVYTKICSRRQNVKSTNNDRGSGNFLTGFDVTSSYKAQALAARNNIQSGG